MKNNLIILDWDDTCFPTTCLTKNNNFQNQKEYNTYIKNLDDILLTFLSHCTSQSETIIITNASEKWIWMTLDILPKTEIIIKKHINIISARDLYQNKYSDMNLWKLHTFHDIYSKHKYFKNIISIGDSLFEFQALVSLYNPKSSGYFKNVKLLSEPNCYIILDQIQVLTKNIKLIVSKNTNLDMIFKKTH